jgi:hypothetical protein
MSCATFDRRMLLAAAGAAFAFPRAAQEPSSAWRPLFDGKSLKGWNFYQQGGGSNDADRVIAIRDKMLHFLGPQYRGEAAPSGHISTDRSYGNYHLRLDFRWGERRYAPRAWQRRNGGLLYHMGPQTDRLFPPCVEFQVEEGDVGDAIMVDTLGLHGPVLGGTPLWPGYFPGLPQEYETPVRAGGLARQWHRHTGNYERLDGWNTLDLIAFEDQAAHLVNGRIVNTLFRMVRPEAAGHAPLTEGRIALEFEQAEIFLRDVRLRPLSADDIARIRRQGSY